MNKKSQLINLGFSMFFFGGTFFIIFFSITVSRWSSLDSSGVLILPILCVVLGLIVLIGFWTLLHAVFKCCPVGEISKDK